MASRSKWMVELARALVVLALLFLNFGHSAFAATPTGPDGAPAVSGTAHLIFCGDMGDPAGSGDHAPCHACRLGAALDLPVPPPFAVRAHPKPVVVGFAEPHQSWIATRLRTAASPRGPPLLG